MRRHLVVIVLVAASSCEAGPASEWPVRSDSAGVGIVRWGPEDTGLDWSFERVFDIGEADGPAAFGRVMPSGIGVDGSGSIHVLDVLNFQVVVFDSAGNLVRTVGRSGAGPGEFRFPSDLGVRADGSEAVFDFDRRGFVVFDASGEPVPEVAARGPLMRRVAFTRSGIAGAYRFEDSGDGGTQTAAASQAPASSIRLVMIGPAGDSAVTLASVPEQPVRQVDMGCATVGFRPLLGPVLTWQSAGGRTAISSGTAYAIDIHDAGISSAGPAVGTRPDMRWSRELAPLQATAPLAAAQLGGDTLRLPGGCRVATVEAAERIGFAETASHITDIAVTPAGGVWAARRHQAGSVTIDVWSAEGEYLGTLPPGSPFPAAFQGPDRIVTVERDTLGVSIVRVWRISRP